LNVLHSLPFISKNQFYAIPELFPSFLFLSYRGRCPQPKKSTTDYTDNTDEESKPDWIKPFHISAIRVIRGNFLF